MYPKTIEYNISTILVKAEYSHALINNNINITCIYQMMTNENIGKCYWVILVMFLNRKNFLMFQNFTNSNCLPYLELVWIVDLVWISDVQTESKRVSISFIRANGFHSIAINWINRLDFLMLNISNRVRYRS